MITPLEDSEQGNGNADYDDIEYDEIATQVLDEPNNDYDGIAEYSVEETIVSTEIPSNAYDLQHSNNEAFSRSNFVHEDVKPKTVIENPYYDENDGFQGNADLLENLNDCSVEVPNIKNNPYYEDGLIQNASNAKTNEAVEVVDLDFKSTSNHEAHIDGADNLDRIDTTNFRKINAIENPYYCKNMKVESCTNELNEGFREDEHAITNDDSMIQMNEDEDDILIDINTDTFQKLTKIENPYYCEVVPLQCNIIPNQNVSENDSKYKKETKTELNLSRDGDSSQSNIDSVSFQECAMAQNKYHCRTEAADIQTIPIEVNARESPNLGQLERRRKSSIYTLMDGVVLNLEAGEVQVTSSDRDTIKLDEI